MKQITCYLDVVSPFAYLAFEKLPEALQGLSYSVRYRPLLFAALLKHHGQLGPAEMPSKRAWTYRHVLWLGRAQGVPLAMPASHPFNPLPLLRLALATSDNGDISRYVAEAVLRHVWQGGEEALAPERLQALTQQLTPRRDPAGDEVKAQLKANADDAIAAGVFGVPTFAVGDRLFWGLDSLPMLRACLEGDPWFDGPEWTGAAERPAMLRSSKPN